MRELHGRRERSTQWARKEFPTVRDLHEYTTAIVLSLSNHENVKHTRKKKKKAENENESIFKRIGYSAENV